MLHLLMLHFVSIISLSSVCHVWTVSTVLHLLCLVCTKCSFNSLKYTPPILHCLAKQVLTLSSPLPLLYQQLTGTNVVCVCVCVIWNVSPHCPALNSDGSLGHTDVLCLSHLLSSFGALTQCQGVLETLTGKLCDVKCDRKRNSLGLVLGQVHFSPFCVVRSRAFLAFRLSQMSKWGVETHSHRKAHTATAVGEPVGCVSERRRVN